MNIIKDVNDSSMVAPAVVTFGVFDGLHLGHQLIMRRVVERAAATGLPATVITFEPHPRAVLHPLSAPPLLQTFDQKMNAMKVLGIQQVVVVPFTQEFSLRSGEDFLLEIVFGRLDAKEVYLGKGFAFGHGREGRFELLKSIADRLGRTAEEVPEVSVGGHRVSSTTIRKLLVAGRVNPARKMLGRPYGIESRVVEGNKVGKAQLSYATANLKPHNTVIPADGVYATLTMVEGQWRQSITNVGHRPTFGGDREVTIETHILDYDRQLYGEKIRVRFLFRLRPEMKFGSLDMLKAQIDRDVNRALDYFTRSGVQEKFRGV